MRPFHRQEIIRCCRAPGNTQTDTPPFPPTPTPTPPSPPAAAALLPPDCERPGAGPRNNAKQFGNFAAAAERNCFGTHFRLCFLLIK
ncbi:hypothetical protein E2C01_092557 [Portunus trituberculatus]|uniref:Uncharacterized protein n=1 Tax=Portunus trituberculatus TaxID=210409 RepID=A0A5B7JS19_PORTR|nr:hypothetical protein [Portunus trituberculatus]